MSTQRQALRRAEPEQPALREVVPTLSWNGTTIARAVGAELRRLRERAGLSQADLEVLSGIARPIVCRAERGVHVQKLETCARLAEACGGGLGHVLVAVDRAIGALP